MMNTQFKIKKLCIDCGKEISRGAEKYCRECHYNHNRGKENPRYKNGVSLVEHSCKKCGNRICLASFYKNRLCRQCYYKYNKKEKHPSYKNGVTLIKHYCKDCGKQISVTGFKGNGRCVTCARLLQRGKNSPAYKGGLPHCKDCGKLLKSYKSIRCYACCNEIKKGKRLSKEAIEKLSGENASNWKGGKPHCRTCGKLLKSYESNYCPRCSRLGKRCIHWIDGRSYEPYPITFNSQLKDRIRVRDNFICQKCGVPELECSKKLHIHHIDYNKKNCAESNLISLCQSCNSKVNANREHWTNYFQKTMQGV